MNMNKVGKFYISEALVKNESSHNAMCSIMSKMIIIRAEYLFAKQKFEYFAISDLFESNPDGCIVPTYKIIIGTHGFMVEKETDTV